MQDAPLINLGGLQVSGCTCIYIGIILWLLVTLCSMSLLYPWPSATEQFVGAATGLAPQGIIPTYPQMLGERARPAVLAGVAMLGTWFQGALRDT